MVLLVVHNSHNAAGSGYRTNSSAHGAAQAVVNPLDQVSSADIAVNVAYLTALPETPSVENHADSFNAMLTTQHAQEDTIVSKPQIVATAAKSKKDISKYTTVEGDTITGLAQKFGVTSDSIRWSNALTAEHIAAGKQLVIPPVGINGIVYTVKSGDTPENLAQKYSANKEQITAFNDAEIAGLKPGELIIIPGGVQPVTRSSSVVSSGFAWGGYTAVYSNNGYDYGWCTWWAAKRRADIGRPIPSNLGNANTWAVLAQRAGFTVDTTPEAGAVAYYRFIGGLGHVGYVEQINDDGSAWLSDMNSSGVSEIGGSTPAGGWGRRSFHLVQPSSFGTYLFIH